MGLKGGGGPGGTAWREETRPGGRHCLFTCLHAYGSPDCGFVPVREVVGGYGSVFGGVRDQRNDSLGVGSPVVWNVRSGRRC